MRGARPLKSMHNSAEDRVISHVDSHVAAPQPTSINFLRQYVKRLNQQIKTRGVKLTEIQVQKLLAERDHTYVALKMFQKAFAEGDFTARAAVEYSRAHGVHLQDDHAVTVSRPPSAITLKRKTFTHDGEAVTGYTPRPGSELRRSFAISEDNRREQSAVEDMTAVLEERSRQSST